jgi:hypothetical protein
MAQKLKFDDLFLTDLEAINGRHLQQWRVSLLLRLNDSLWDMPKYKWHGRYSDSKSADTNLSSCLWHSSGLRGVKITIWYLENMNTRIVLYAEHERTKQNTGALEIALSRAEQKGYPHAAFAPA